VPSVSRVLALLDPNQPESETALVEVEQAAQQLGIQVIPVRVRTTDELNGALEAAMASQPDALISNSVGAVLSINRQATIDFAARHKLPSIEISHAWTQLGGLMGYGPDIDAMYRRAGAYYVDRILRGARPADLPIEQPTQFEFSVNRTTARALGISIPADFAAQVTLWID
jgi:putative ABC transport system substrate-binding protein